MRTLQPYLPPSSAIYAVGRMPELHHLAWSLLVGLVVMCLAMVFVPWQQTAPGEGRVIAYAPVDRRQSIDAPIKGRVVEWLVSEGQTVQVGDPIARISDNDPQYLDRLQAELAAVQSQRDSIRLSIAMSENRVDSLVSARDHAIDNAEQAIVMAKEKLTANQAKLVAARVKFRLEKKNYGRLKRLLDKGIYAQRDVELGETKLEAARANFRKAQADVKSARASVRAYTSKRSETGQYHKAKIASTKSSVQKLHAERAKSEASIAKSQVQVARAQQMLVKAERPGTVLKFLVNEKSDYVKAGEALVSFVPDAGARAVELYFGGNDAPLVGKGREVRIQFHGWPALQFVGWPSVAVGTFGGVVAFVDAHADDQGNFRAVVVPQAGSDWPNASFLRQGVRARGWVLLDRVRLGFEIWRQINGFQPALTGQASQKKKGKKP